MDNLIYIDDSDPRVFYNENTGWETKDTEWAFGSTAHGAKGTMGAQALLTFAGTSVVVYGTISSNTQGNSTYSIDGSTPSTFINPILSANTYQQIFYKSPRLENRQHILMIKPSTQPDGMFWLDFFVVTQPPAALASDQISPTTQGPSPVPSQKTSDLPGSPIASETTSTPITSVSIDSTWKATSTSALLHSSTDAKSMTQPLAAAQSSATPDMQHASTKAIIGGSVTGGILILLVIAFFVWRGYKHGNAFHSISTTILTPTEPSRLRHAAMHDARLFHKSPGIAITDSLHSAEALLSQETREFVEILPPTSASNVEHVELHPGSSVENPPTYTQHTSLPV